MSRRQPQKEIRSDRGDLPPGKRSARGAFRGGRLSNQIVLALALAGAAALSTRMPEGPFTRLRAGLTWMATHDYDFRGQTLQVSQWAQQRGGWLPAASSLWKTGTGRVRGWMAPLLARGTELPIWPVKGPILRGYGWLPPSDGHEMHEALDIQAAPGSPVVAAADGLVVRVAEDPALGGVVEVDHGTAMLLYAQVDGIRVKPGDQVRRGEALANIAQASGHERTQEPHLHLEVRIPASGGERVDPAAYLSLGGKEV